MMRRCGLNRTVVEIFGYLSGVDISQTGITYYRIHANDQLKKRGINNWQLKNIHFLIILRRTFDRADYFGLKGNNLFSEHWKNWAFFGNIIEKGWKIQFP